MTRLEALCDAIKTFEGWYPFSRSWRNNNPGNLRHSKFQSSYAGGFAKFPNFATGWLALWYDVYKKCIGETQTALRPTSSLYDFFNVWAPGSDGNQPHVFTEWVARRLKIPPETKLKYFTDDLG